jgi:hypothetical protein
MSASCSTHVRDEKCIQNFDWKILREEVTCRWEDNIRMDLRERRCVGVDWIHLAQDRDRWRVLVNTVMNLRIP